MKLAFFMFLFLSTNLFHAQPEIKFDLDKKVYDYGVMFEGDDAKRKVKFTNVGDAPLIIMSSKSSGGLITQYPKNPIEPGESDYFTLFYDTKRIGPINKTMTVASNAKNRHLVVRTKGEVIYRPSIVSVKNKTINMGEIEYGEISTATFTLQNTGDQILHFNTLNSSYWQPEEDIFSEKVYMHGNEKPVAYGCTFGFKRGNFFFADVTIRNIHGNSGDFKKRLPYLYNSHDTIWLTVTGKFVGSPSRKIIYEKRDAFYYTNGSLFKRVTYGSQASIHKIDYFKDSNCFKSERFNRSTGEMIEIREYRNGLESKKSILK